MQSQEKKDISSLLGEKLLLGWVMLNDVCSKCVVVPLLEDRSDKKIICLQCNRTFKRDANGIDIFEIQYISTPPPLPPRSHSPIKNISNTVYSDDEDFDYEDDTPLTEEELKQIEERMNKSNIVSSKIGEFLLLGWSMLSEICPCKSCYGVPLLKNKEGKYHCVSCNRYVYQISELKTAVAITPIKINSEPQQEIINDAHVPSMITKRVNEHTATINIPNSDNLSPTKEPDYKKLKPTTTTTTTSSSIDIKTLNSNLMVVTCNTIFRLTDKLAELEKHLEKTPITEIQNSVNTLALIREYSITLQSLLELKQKQEQI